MQVVRTLDEHVELTGGGVLAIGFFDGVHRGHRQLLGTVVERAHALEAAAVALTFEDHPQCLFTPGACPFWLTTVDEKLAALAEVGLDCTFVVPFDWTVASQTAEEFAWRLREQYGMRELVCGADFALGKDRAGTVDELRTLGATMGFSVNVVAPVPDQEQVISSTLIRECIARGDIAQATKLLGRPYSLPGKVVSGQGLGRKLGVPTINLETPARKVVPAHGVYAVWTEWAGVRRPAVANLGVRPTVGGGQFAIEAHLLNQQIDSSPPHLALHFIARLRAEQRFPSLDDLVAQIGRDCAAAQVALAHSELPKR